MRSFMLAYYFVSSYFCIFTRSYRSTAVSRVICKSLPLKLARIFSIKTHLYDNSWTIIRTFNERTRSIKHKHPAMTWNTYLLVISTISGNCRPYPQHYHAFDDKYVSLSHAAMSHVFSFLTGIQWQCRTLSR